MKALFISNDSLIFDTQSAVHARLALYATAIGELHVLSHTRDRHAKESHENNLHLYPVHASIFTRIHKLSRKAKELMRAKEIEVVSAQDAFEHGLAAWWATKGTDVRLHLQIHTDFLSPYFSAHSFKNRLRVRLADYLLPKAHGVRAVSKRIHDSLIVRYGTKIGEASIIPVSIDTRLPGKIPLPVAATAFTLVAVSRLEKEKRIEDILHALALLPPRYHMVSLVVVGDGREKGRLIRLARRLGISPRVSFLGWRTDAWGLMQNAHAFIQASAYEGYGVTLIQAALAGRPMITTDVGIVGEVFTKEKAVLVVPISSPHALALAITQMVEDDTGLRSALAYRAEKEARAHLEAFANMPAHMANDLKRLFAAYRYE